MEKREEREGEEREEWGSEWEERMGGANDGQTRLRGKSSLSLKFLY